MRPQGLGKTVQIITFLSVLSQNQGARPFLVAVPNSTMGNCALARTPSHDGSPFDVSLPAGVREFERWAPSMRVVPYGVRSLSSRRSKRNFDINDVDTTY